MSFVSGCHGGNMLENTSARHKKKHVVPAGCCLSLEDVCCYRPFFLFQNGLSPVSILGFGLHPTRPSAPPSCDLVSEVVVAYARSRWARGPSFLLRTERRDHPCSQASWNFVRPQRGFMRICGHTAHGVRFLFLFLVCTRGLRSFARDTSRGPPVSQS